MKHLESVKLVQFFLFEKQEVRLKEITGIFGPNGSGKSSIIDAVQIAMFGANSRLISLNAQADERASSRTIRSYCLGMQDQTKRARDNATTYITLVWRDSVTLEPVSMGVCLYASNDADGHEVRGRYILPGIELSMDDHLETIEKQERPRSWETFRHNLLERAKMTGEDPFFSDSERYIKSALYALRGSNGVPSLEIFKNAFRFALKMRFDKSVDSIVRNDVFVARPTNIQKFKEVTESFRKLAQMVSQVKTKIEDGERVESEFSKAETASGRAITWNGVYRLVEKEKAVAVLNSAIEQKEATESALSTLKDEFANENVALENAKSDERRYRELRMGHAAYKEHGALSLEISRESATEDKKAKEVRANISLIRNLLNEASNSPYLQSNAFELNAAIKSIDAALPTLPNIDKIQLSALLKLPVKEASRAVSELFKSSVGINNELTNAQKSLELSESAMLRVKDGRSRLSHETEGLLAELRNNGLHPTPVCDLVRITDPEWQPVIEAYLSRNVEALLVEKHEEANAFAIYRGLSGPRAIYGAKIVAANKQGEVSAEMGSVAELIVGDHPAAVAYLRRQFGGMHRATTDAEALAGQRTLTQDGMIVKSGEYDRIKPAFKSNLKIGGGDDSQKETLTTEIAQLRRRISELTTQQAAIKRLSDSLMNIANESNAMNYILSSFDEMQTARSAVESLTKQLSDSADTEYLRLGELEQSHGKLVQEIQPKVDKLISDIGRADEKHEQSIRQEAAAIHSCEQADIAFEVVELNTQYDRDYAAKQWDALLEKHDEQYQLMSEYCISQEDVWRSSMENAIARGSKELGVFKEKYREQGAVNSDDWRNEREWMIALLKRLRETELSEFDAQMKDAFRTSQETFRTDVAIALSNNIDTLNRDMHSLNQVLSTCPVFSNGERYRFQRTVRPQLKRLLKFVQDIAAFGPNDDLLGGAGEMPEEFRELLEDKIVPGAAGVQSPLDDYREFFEFDIEILREDSLTHATSVVGSLSKRLGTGSGGEHRAPLYVIAGAALASAYRLNNGSSDGIRLMLLDEAFNKMDTANIVATMRYLEQLGLQLFMASPGGNLGTLTAFLHRYYDILRDVENSAMLIQGHDVSEIDRDMFRSDLAEFNEELVAQELAAIRDFRTNAEPEALV